MKKSKKASRGPAPFTVLAALLTLAGLVTGAAGPAYAAAKITQEGGKERVAASASCPNGLPNAPVATNVAASFTIIGNTTQYTFSSLVNENPVNGVPGLIKFCVYATMQPTGVMATAKGADNTDWIALRASRNFAFSRQFGNPSNIPLNASGPVVMGTATWTGAAPTTQNILLHINDPKVCASLGLGNTTCFVKPSTGPVCNAGTGSTVAAYNAYPFGVVDCGPPAFAFEGNFAAEFGDRVQLASGGGNKLAQLNVDFQSYGCGVSGGWSLGLGKGPCVTNANQTFSIPVTATIYAVQTSGCPGGQTACRGAVLAQALNVNQTIPYRPSADSQQCQDGRWFNTVSQMCRYSIGKVLSFNLGSVPLPAGTTEVIWTVAFNTTHAGYAPIGENTTCFQTNNSNPGCGYDSLNVGTLNFPNAPYAGVDVNNAEVFIAWQANANTLQQIVNAADWDGFRPLGQIITTP